MDKKIKCLNCAKEAVAEYKPFCSKRCADVDLGRWLNESYSIPAEDVTDIESEENDE